jgi:hypothetical protein
MSYLSKSKWMSRSSATSAKSFTGGRAGVAVDVPPLVVGAAVDGWALEAVPLLPGDVKSLGRAGAAPVPPVVPAAPVGAGADACVVAGRFAHPVAATAAISNEPRTTCEQRVPMLPSFSTWKIGAYRITADATTTKDL